MSITAEVLRRAAEGRLIELKPLHRRIQVVRRLFLSPGVHKQVERGSDDSDEDAELWIRVFEDLMLFVRGDRVSVPRTPRKHAECLLAPLGQGKDGVWEFRHFPLEDPATRLLGRFPARNWFVGLEWNYRGNLDTEDDWSEAIRTTICEWGKLIPTYPPLIGDPTGKGQSYDEYLSNYFYP